MKKYRTIVIDPPWKYGVWGVGSKKSKFFGYKDNEIKQMPYIQMTIEQIASLPILSLSDYDCELYLWTTQKYIPVSYSILTGWGFKYCETLTWCKRPMGSGQGGLYTPTSEFIIHGRVGRMPKKQRIDTTWWLVKRPHNAHSKKPEFFQDIIETVSDEPRLEMFARRHRLGWDVWGNEVESDVQIPAR